jgi:hypothetical protein
MKLFKVRAEGGHAMRRRFVSFSLALLARYEPKPATVPIRLAGIANRAFKPARIFSQPISDNWPGDLPKIVASNAR